MYELSTNCANPKQLRQTDYSDYDAIYLGDFSCLEYPNNFSSHPQLLEAAVTQLKEQGKKVYLRLYATPGNEDLPQVKEMIEAALLLPIDAFEVHNLGVLRILQQMGSTLPVHLGVFGNLYTDATARVLKDFGVTRVYPNPELSLTEIHYIREKTPIEVCLPVHGKIPLVISETCFIIENSSCATQKVDCNGKEVCNFPCSQDYWLNRSNGEWVLKDTGKMTLSGKDLCMIEHMPELLRDGQNLFYVQSHGETAEYVKTVGRLYRQALQQAEQGQDEQELQVPIDALSALSKEGLCNGYYFEGAGQTYIGRG
ncbi:MAG: peptidase U32 family protein [Motiliproteus sp.]